MDDKIMLNLYEKALEASKKSYSPYSNFPVGAALLMEDFEANSLSQQWVW